MHKSFRVSSEGNRLQVADYMTGFLGFSSRKSKKLIKEKRVRINGKVGYWDNRLKDGDLLEIDLTEEGRQRITPENIPLSIVYEDQYILAVNKPPFMLVHPTPNHQEGTLLNAAAYHFSNHGDQIALRLLNRLDMNTSGLVIIPKSSEMHSKLGEMMKNRQIKKYYTAIVEGVLTPEKGVIDKPIGKDTEDPIKRKVTEAGQKAITIYETVEELKGYSVLKLELITGRTHQIRVHLNHLGHPIVGDSLYGRETELIGRQALHASEMEFVHPVDGHLLKLRAELAADIMGLLNKLKSE